MKTKKLLVALLILILLPMSGLFAQRTAGSYSIGGFVGTGMPMSPDFFKDYWKMGGIGFGGEFIYNFSDKISLGVRFHRLPFPLDTDEIKDLIQAMLQADPNFPAGVSFEMDGMDIISNIISADLLAYLTPPSAPAGIYLTGGASYYQFSFSDLEITVEYLGQSQTITEEMDDEIDDKFGINAGAGIEFNASGNINIFAEGRYHYLFEEEEGPDIEGEVTEGTINFISIVGGIRISL